jgi:peptidoglycan hydrolase CwlO-like protein
MNRKSMRNIFLAMMLSICAAGNGYSSEDQRITTQSFAEKSLLHSEQLYVKARRIAFDLQAQVQTMTQEKEGLLKEIERLQQQVNELRKENDKLRKECYSPEKEEAGKLKLEILEKKVDKLNRKMNLIPSEEEE